MASAIVAPRCGALCFIGLGTRFDARSRIQEVLSSASEQVVSVVDDSLEVMLRRLESSHLLASGVAGVGIRKLEP